MIKWNKDTDQGKSENIDLKKLKFTTNDPAPPFNYLEKKEYADVDFLTKILLDNKNYTLVIEQTNVKMPKWLCQLLLYYGYTCAYYTKTETCFKLF